MWVIFRHARVEHCRFPSRQWQFAAIEQFQGGLQTFGAFRATTRRHALPREKEAVKLMEGDGLNFRAQPVDGEPMNPRQQPALTPFLLCGIGVKTPAQYESFRFQRQKRNFDLRRRQLKQVCKLRRRDGPANFQAPAQQFANSVALLPHFGNKRTRSSGRLK